MRKSIFIIGFWCFYCALSSAQVFDPNAVVGIWKVVGGEVNFPPTPDKSLEKQIAGLKEQFLHSDFVFQGDNNFSFNIKLDDFKVQKAHWKYNPNSYRYEIQLWEDKDKNNSFLMVLEVKKVGDKTYFLLPTDEELPKEFSIKLEVVKMLE